MRKPQYSGTKVIHVAAGAGIKKVLYRIQHLHNAIFVAGLAIPMKMARESLRWDAS